LAVLRVRELLVIGWLLCIKVPRLKATSGVTVNGGGAVPVKL
jgi:hypothetical protein